jgi:hypothetical protein
MIIKLAVALKTTMLLLTASSLFAAPETSPEESKLREYVQLYYGGLQAKDTEVMWNSLSPAIRQRATPKRYKEDLAAFFKEVTVIDFKITQLKIYEQAGHVEVMLKVSVAGEVKPISRLEASRWIYKNERWYLEIHPRVATSWPDAPALMAKEKPGSSATRPSARWSLDDYYSSPILFLNGFQQNGGHRGINVVGSTEVCVWKGHASEIGPLQIGPEQISSF